ncbi:UDP-N-acetylmuramate dehydrogenase [Thermogemmatispora sp.]|uniref:UDP-N-acetylmuramate dehydrogenase n=1 Tax=Thermogemmatispora sp. TaxID=1968838 RepID=UPI002ACBE342|nr:FAD-binding protein [Thermogemmatispora sp.]
MTFDAERVYTTLLPRFGRRLRLHEPLARHCTFGVGGPADLWLTLETRDELIWLVRRCLAEGWPLLVVGNGTNVLFGDGGVRGIVARMALSDYRLAEQEDGSALLYAEAGVSWPKLLNELATQGWGGLEFGPGIPGTLGGGVVSNAGAHQRELSQVLEWVEVLDVRPALALGTARSLADGESRPQADQGHSQTEEEDARVAAPFVRRYERAELELSYRHSRFRAGRQVTFDERGYPQPAPRTLIEPAEIILLLAVRLHRDDPAKLRALIEEYRQHRKRTQPPQPSAGSVFKNPPGDYAGRLIEQVGAKGLRCGRACISERHANFIVNLGGARAADIAALIREARNRVRERFGVELELEVELRGEWEIA